MASDYEVGDIVWAKMKSYPWWPGMIGEPKDDVKKPSGKKPFHFVVFFGSDNYSWVADEYVKPYEPHIEEYSKCNLVSFKAAMKKVEEHVTSAPVKAKPKRKPDTPKANGISFKKRLHDPNKGPSPTKSAKRQKTLHSEPRLVNALHNSDDSNESSTSNNNNTTSIRLNHEARYLPLLSNLSPFMGNSSSSFQDDSFTWTPKPAGLLERQVVEPVSTDVNDMGAILKPGVGFIPPSELRVGFLGLGMMGTGIARHLVNAGIHVTVWNRTPLPVYRFADAGIEVCKTVGDVVRASDVTFSCVSGPAAAKEIVFGNCGVLGAMEMNKGYVEITSIDPKTSKDIETAISEKGGDYLEAPVIGSRELCIAGQLVILAAGENKLFEKCKPLFETFAKHAFYLGAVENAAKMHTLVNMLIGNSLAAFAESMSLAERVNISQQNFLDIMKLGPLKCPLFVEKAEAMMHRKFSPSIRLQHVQKDLQFALQLGHDLIQPLPVTAATNEVFIHAKSLGYADHDISAVYNARY